MHQTPVYTAAQVSRTRQVLVSQAAARWGFKVGNAGLKRNFALFKSLSYKFLALLGKYRRLSYLNFVTERFDFLFHNFGRVMQRRFVVFDTLWKYGDLQLMNFLSERTKLIH